MPFSRGPLSGWRRNWNRLHFSDKVMVMLFCGHHYGPYLMSSLFSSQDEPDVTESVTIPWLTSLWFHQTDISVGLCFLFSVAQESKECTEMTLPSGLSLHCPTRNEPEKTECCYDGGQPACCLIQAQDQTYDSCSVKDCVTFSYHINVTTCFIFLRWL